MGEKEQNNSRLAERLKGVRSQRETTHFCPWQLFSKNNQTIDFPLGCQDTPAFLQSLSGCGFVVLTFDRSHLRLKRRERSLVDSIPVPGRIFKLT